MGIFPKVTIAVLSLLIILIILPQSSKAQKNKVNETFAGPILPWTELIFKGSKFFTSTTLNIKLGSGDQLSGDLSTEIGTDIGDCSENLYDSKLLTVQFTTRGVGFSQNQYEEKIWFKETTFRPYKRIRLNRGDAPWVKSYCWGDEGVRRQKNVPGNLSENKQAPDTWTKRTESFYEYPEEVAGCDSIFDPSLVFYILSTFQSGNQLKPFEICVFGRKQLHRMTIVQEKYSSLKVSYKSRSASPEVIVDDEITPSVFSITTETFSPLESEQAIFSFFGLHKDIRIYMDSEKRLPVRITGRSNSWGGITLDLRNYSR